MQNKGTISFNSPEYPSKLKKIDSPPKSLQYKGVFNQEILHNTLAVVGSRRMTSYGKLATEKLVKDVASAGITIVSGFMYGIDATAHRAALDVGGKTIAVLPCGVDVIHPAHQKKLYNAVLENGFFLSEYKDNDLPDKWKYPQRNRIVVGISSAVLVIEAEEKSGTLISANLAKKYNKTLFAVPGPIFNKTSQGANSLLKEGALPVTSSQDILHFFKKDVKIEENKAKTLSKEEQSILEAVKNEPLEKDELARKLNIPLTKLNSTISLLEIKDFIKKEGRKYYPQ
jgi:DNA processing protein